MPYYRVTSFRMIMEEVVNDVQAGNEIAGKGGGKIENREIHIPTCSTQVEGPIAVSAR